MFYYFFEEYKDKIYKGSRRKLKWYEILLLSAIVFDSLLCMLSFALRGRTIKFAILFGVLLLLVATAWIYTNRYFKKNRESLLKGHKEKHIEPLCQQLREHNLYTESGIEWLIDCCREKRQRNLDFPTKMISTVKTFFMGAIYPLITLAIGLALKDSTSDDITSFIAVLFVIYLVGVGTILCLQPIVLFMLFPDKNIVDYLEEDLKYIGTQIIDKQP